MPYVIGNGRIISADHMTSDTITVI